MTELNFWGQSLPNGTFKIHIQGGISPYKVVFSMNGDIIRIIKDIPQSEDINCIVQDLPAGSYKITIKDSSYPTEDVYAYIAVKNNISRLRKNKLLKLNSL